MIKPLTEKLQYIEKFCPNYNTDSKCYRDCANLSEKLGGEVRAVVLTWAETDVVQGFVDSIIEKWTAMKPVCPSSSFQTQPAVHRIFCPPVGFPAAL